MQDIKITLDMFALLVFHYCCDANAQIYLIQNLEAKLLS